MKRITAVILVCCAVMSLFGCAKGAELKLGTGDVTGSYYAHGTELAESLADSSVTLKTHETAGSAANIRLISEGYIDLAFVQSDILRDAYNGTGMFKEACTGYSAVAGLYTEACQLVAAAGSGIETVSDLYGKRVSLGEEGSGVVQNAAQIMSAYGIAETAVQARYLSFTDSAAALKSGDIDAFFCTAGVPTGAVAELAESTAIKLIPIDDETADRIIEQYGGYTKYTIEAGTYAGQTEPIDALGIKTVLIARNSVSEDTVKTIAARLFEGGFGFVNDVEYAVTDIPVGFHNGAVEYYKEHAIDVEKEAKSR